MHELHSEEELLKLALRKGKTLTVGGKAVNRAGAKISKPRQALNASKPAKPSTANSPEKVPDPTPIPPVGSLVPALPPIVNVDLSKLEKGNDVLTSILKELLKHNKSATVVSPPNDWQFDILRDDKGFIKSMTAKHL